MIGRRQLLGGMAAAFAAACTGASRRDVARPTDAPARPPTTPELWSWFDLPAGDPRSRELSGIAWDPKERVLWAVQDEAPRIVGLLPDESLRTWTFGETIELECGGPVDLEGIVVVPGGFLVCSEQGPRIIEIDRKGRFVRDHPLPPHFDDARHNRSLESLTVSPSGRYLFTTTEAALKHDGAGATHRAGTRVRVVRFDLENGDLTEHTYVTDAMQYDEGDWGIADLAAVSDTQLYVLERGWALGHGNTVRVYDTSLADARASCVDIDRLAEGSPALSKRLVIDLAQVTATGLPPVKQPQASPILDNYEGLALGPPLPSMGPRQSRSLIMVSDDNGRADQVARIVVLALRQA